MKIKFLHLLTGASDAEGIAVVIDVFRAFSLEAYLFNAGIKTIYPVETLDKARKLKEDNPYFILFGERQGIIQSGFDHGNSPYLIQNLDLAGKTAVHASSSGTRGLVAAMNSSAAQVVTGSFVNAKAITEYIKLQDPETVSLIDMGWAGEHCTLEDTICAQYIYSLLTDTEFKHPDYIYEIYQTDGKRFFLPQNQSSMPSDDFFLCLRKDIFPFILKAEISNSFTILNKHYVY